LTPSVTLIASILLFLVIEGAFLVVVYRMASAGKRKSEAEFRLLDQERSEVLDLQKRLLEDIQEAHKATRDGVTKLNKIGTEAHAEWTDMTQRIDEVMREIETKAADLVTTNLQKLSRKSLELQKSLQEASEAQSHLCKQVAQAQKVIRFFDTSVKLDDLLKDLQMDKYAQARQMLQGGADSELVSRELGLTLSEVSLVSHTL
jgi:DNA anti-recombination protein RmuC